MWWLWIVGGLTVWAVVALLVAVVLGRGIRMADERSPGTGVLPAVATRSAASRRGWVPLPAIGVAIIAVALALETAGYVLRLTGATGTLSRMLSMDAPFSVPRMFVAGIFAVAAFAAVAGAGVHRGRRTWWLAVGAVAAGISAVKAGSTVHADALRALTRLLGFAGALAFSALLAAAVVGALWFLSRDERRDRRRVLSALSLYGVAVVGLSALSSSVAGSAGPNWAAAATFVEESGEALAGVAYLMAVLIGVAPQLVLPASWALRRRADAEADAVAARRPELPRP